MLFFFALFCGKISSDCIAFSEGCYRVKFALIVTLYLFIRILKGLHVLPGVAWFGCLYDLNVRTDEVYSLYY